MTMASELAIDIQGLTHTYKDGYTALDDVNLHVGTGLFGLLGPNGAGKSTLMRIICTLLEPSKGRVLIGGHDVVEERQRVRALLGYLPQDFGGWRLHRVEEVLDTLAQMSGLLDKKTRRARVDEVLEQVGLAEVADRKVKKLSGGMVRRLGVAQALVHEPRILVVDEPTVGLDPEERIRFRQLMGNLGRDRTILLSTHIVADLGGACQEIALLDAGHVIFQGPPSKLLTAAEGHVFEVEAELKDADAVEIEYEIVSRASNGSKITLRGVSESTELPSGAQPVQSPTLEESYIAFMATRGRSAAAREDNESLMGDAA
jgi:ABC-type multidrug transport system ATPase subunit